MSKSDELPDFSHPMAISRDSISRWSRELRTLATVSASPRNPETIELAPLMGRLHRPQCDLWVTRTAWLIRVSALLNLVFRGNRAVPCVAKRVRVGWHGSWVDQVVCRMVERRFIDHIRRDTKIAADRNPTRGGDLSGIRTPRACRPQPNAQGACSTLSGDTVVRKRPPGEPFKPLSCSPTVKWSTSKWLSCSM